MYLFNNSTNFFNEISASATFRYNTVFWCSTFGLSAVFHLISVYLFCTLILISLEKKESNQSSKKTEEVAASSKSADFNSNQEAKCQNPRKNNSPKASNSRRIELRTKNSKTNEQSSIALNVVLLATVFLNILKGIVEMLLFFIGGDSDRICNILTILMVVITGLTVYGCVVFYSMRQYVLHSNPSTEHLSPKGAKYIGALSYFEIFVTITVCFVIHMWWRDYATADGFCRPVLESQRLSLLIAFGLAVFSTVIFQITLT